MRAALARVRSEAWAPGGVIAAHDAASEDGAAVVAGKTSEPQLDRLWAQYVAAVAALSATQRELQSRAKVELELRALLEVF